MEKYAGRMAPGIAAYLARAEELFSHTAGDMTADEQRRAFTALCQSFAGPHPDGLSVRDAAVPGPHGDIPVRIYGPAGTGTTGGLVYFHGGGWVVGDLDSHDDHCAWMAAEAGVVIVSVDYPLAPENRHPVPFEACDAAVRHIAAHAADYGIDPARLGVGGDSAGAALAAAVALKARDEGGPALALQLLIYPTLGSDHSLPSFAENADAAAVHTLQEALEAVRQAYQGTDGELALAAKTRFYDILYGGGSSETLASLLTMVQARIWRWRAVGLMHPNRGHERLSESVSNLTLLVAAIENGDGDLAEQITRKEVSRAAEEVMRLIAAEQDPD